MKIFRTATVILFVFITILPGCYYDKEALLYPGTSVDCNVVSAKFTDVRAIISLKCASAGCHNAGTAAGGAVLETYDQVSKLSARIMQRVIIEKTMPPGAPLSAQELAILECWINSGTPNN